MSVAIDHGYVPLGKYVVNHDIMHCTAEGVVGNYLYSGRALGISEPEDIIQLHPDLSLLWTSIHAHYERIGLRHSQNVIWDTDPHEIGAHIGYQPSVFYYGPDESRYWGDSRWLETVEYINSKNNFMSLANELNVDVPKTLCFDSVAEINPDCIADLTYPCYLKAAVSVSGVGIYRCDDRQALISAMGCFSECVPVQIQEEVITDTFLNLQYRVIGNEVIRLAASEQILDGFAHQGNRFPARYEPWKSVDTMAYWLRDHGMKGIFAFDVAVMQTNRGLRFPVIECNPRYNGATYPTLIAQKLDIKEWSAISLPTSYRKLSKIKLMDIEFDRKSGEGVILVNWGTILEGKLVFLIAGSGSVQDSLKVELQSRL